MRRVFFRRSIQVKNRRYSRASFFLQASNKKTARLDAHELERLDALLLDQSYVHGWTPGPPDHALFERLSVKSSSSAVPSLEQLPNLSRWCSHMRALNSRLSPDLSADSETELLGRKVRLAYVLWRASPPVKMVSHLLSSNFFLYLCQFPMTTIPTTFLEPHSLEPFFAERWSEL